MTVIIALSIGVGMTFAGTVCASFLRGPFRLVATQAACFLVCVGLLAWRLLA